MEPWQMLAVVGVVLAAVGGFGVYRFRRLRRQLAEAQQKLAEQQQQQEAEELRRASARWRSRPCGGGDGPPVTD